MCTGEDGLVLYYKREGREEENGSQGERVRKCSVAIGTDRDGDQSRSHEREKKVS